MDVQYLVAPPLVRPPDSNESVSNSASQTFLLKSGGHYTKQTLVKMVRRLVREGRAGRERREPRKR